MDTISYNILHKYSPKTIKDIIGSEQQIKNIVSWLTNFNKNKQNRHNKTQKNKNTNMFSSILISGDNGTGKTSIINAILNDMKYTVKTVNFRTLDINSHNIIEQIIVSGNIYNKIQNINNNKIVIVIDELEFLSTSIEKNIISDILKKNSDDWICPVIFIGNNKHKKIITLVKKESYYIKLYPPDENNMMKLLERICLGENIVFENDMRSINKLIEYSQNDYRRLIIILGELFRIYNGNIITYDNVIVYLMHIGNKDIDMTIYQNTNKLFTEFNDIASILKIFESDKTNIPLMVHQNYFTAINNYNNNKDNIMDITKNISKYIAHGDIIDNYIYSEQNWNLQEIYGFYTCIYPSFVINNNIDTKTLLRDMSYPRYMPKYTTVYPKDYNKTSTKCINFKNIKYANNFFENINISDYLYICKYIKFMLINNRIIECKNILKTYNINMAGIAYVLKIDKINGTKKDITKELEKKIKEISNEPIKQSVIRNKLNKI